MVVDRAVPGTVRTLWRQRPLLRVFSLVDPFYRNAAGCCYRIVAFLGGIDAGIFLPVTRQNPSWAPPDFPRGTVSRHVVVQRNKHVAHACTATCSVCCPSLQMTTTPRRFLLEDYDDHDGSRVVVCTINVHIVCLVESVVRDGPQQKRKPPQSARELTVRRSGW